MSWGLVMPAPLSRDLRERIVAAILDGSSSAQVADAERDAPDSAASLNDLINRVRQLRAELVAVHPKSADALRRQIGRRT